MLSDPTILLAFAIVYVLTGLGLLALAGGFSKSQLQPQPIRVVKGRFGTKG